MVLHEREHPVQPVVEGLEAVDAIAVRLQDVYAVLRRVPYLQIPEDEAIGAVGANRDVLLRSDAVGPAGRPPWPCPPRR